MDFNDTDGPRSHTCYTGPSRYIDWGHKRRFLWLSRAGSTSHTVWEVICISGFAFAMWHSLNTTTGSIKQGTKRSTSVAADVVSLKGFVTRGLLACEELGYADMIFEVQGQRVGTVIDTRLLVWIARVATRRHIQSRVINLVNRKSWSAERN